MYDLPGSDSGREWVEITNTGTDSVDISGYKFSEGGTNHTLSVLTGSSLMVAGGTAIIVDNAAKFAADWPQFTGTTIKSSFSLSNTGETISLKDSTLILLDSAAYTSDGGAAGDGNTLHRVDNTLIAAAPDPGVYTAVVAQPTPDPTPAPVEPTPTPTQDPTPTISEPAPTSDTSSESTTTPAVDTATTTTVTTETTTQTPSSPTPTPTSAQTSTPAPAQTQPTSQTTTPAPKSPSLSVKTTTQAPAAPKTTASMPVAVVTHAESVAVTPAPVVAKTVSSSKKSSSGFKTTVAQASSLDSGQVAAPALDQSTVPSQLLLYIVGLFGLIALGVAGSLYLTKNLNLVQGSVTSNTTNEFELE